MLQPAERADARANRARLLDAAVAVFAARGTDAEIREVAERAHLAVGTVYNHFPSKDDLIVAVVERAVREFDQALTDALAQPDPVAAVHGFVRDGLAVVERYGDLMSAMLEGRLPAARAAVSAGRAAFAERVAELVARGIRGGAFRPEVDPAVAAAMLRSVFLPWTFADLRRTRTIEQITASLMDVLLDGVRATLVRP